MIKVEIAEIAINISDHIIILEFSRIVLYVSFAALD